jgi:Cell division protein 48 (CDC48), N-terminal domain.
MNLKILLYTKCVIEMMSDNSAVSLRVYENEIQDKDREIVRIDPDIMQILNISDGDFIDVIGSRNGTTIICLSLHPSDKTNDKDKKKIIRIDSKTRNLIGTAIGDTVTIKKAILTERGSKSTRPNTYDVSDEASNSITMTGSCVNFEKDRPKIMEFLRSLEKELHLDNSYCKCYTSGKKTLGWDFFEISVDSRLVKKLFEIHPEINKQESASLEERFVLWLHAKFKKSKLNYYLKINEIPYESVTGFRLNPNDFRDVDDMENMR